MILSSGDNMVIATRVYLDKIEGFRNESFQVEEILLALNKGQFRLLDNLIDKNFQQGIIRYEWLSQLQAQEVINAVWNNIPLIGYTEVQFSAAHYYLVSALANVSLDTDNYSVNGTSEKCLNEIPPIGVSLPPVPATPVGDKEILSFSIPGQMGSTYIDSRSSTVKISMYSQTDLSALIPQMTISPDTTIAPFSGEVQDFNVPVSYIVTHTDLTTQTWTVTVSNAVTEIVQLDISETGKAVDKEHNSFYGRDYRNPRAELINDGLRLWRGPQYIIESLVVDQISKPTDIDNTSDAITEWPESALQKIVDYAVEYMRLTIEDPAYQGNVNDFNLRTHNSPVG